LVLIDSRRALNAGGNEMNKYWQQNKQRIQLAAYLSEQNRQYIHKVQMADAMENRGDAYGEKESMNYLEKASDILFNMQMVSADPASYDLEMN
jgi:hypothetical protein